MRSRNLLIAFQSTSARSVVLSFAVQLASKICLKIFSKVLCKILLPAAETSLTGLKVFYDCSGGNSRPSRLSGVGGGNFLGPNVRRFPLARDHALARLRLNRNAQLRTSDVEIRKSVSRHVANRVGPRGADHCSNDSCHRLAVGELAGAHSAAKHG